MMGSSTVRTSLNLKLLSPCFLHQTHFTYTQMLASSRQTFAFARDGGLPFSRYIYRVNPYTKGPLVGVWLAALVALLLGLLAFAGPAAISAVFSLAVAGQNLAYSIPILARITSAQKFIPGPFCLGKLVRPSAMTCVPFLSR